MVGCALILTCIVVVQVLPLAPTAPALERRDGRR
jgi:hypothetical protein